MVLLTIDPNDFLRTLTDPGRIDSTNPTLPETARRYCGDGVEADR